MPVFFILGALAGCGKKGDPPRADAGADAASDPVVPPSMRELGTTDGAISFGNLNSQIHVLSADDRRVDTRLALAALVAQRGTFTARVADYERALELAESAVRDAPRQPDAWIARASARSTFHRFADAIADLDSAERLGAQPSQTRAARASILQATGDLDGALALRRADSEAAPDIRALGMEAALLGELERYDEAEQLFRRALASYGNVSPFPVAWLLFQECVMWERAGRAPRARAFCAAAHERLPIYAHAASHLALLEKAPRAIELLSPVAAASDDPEFELVLAQRLREAGFAAQAAERLARVRARYDELGAKHPEAFAEHAASFWLDEGKDPAKALSLAKQNLAVRKTGKAYELAVLAAIAAGAREEACAIGTEGLSRPHVSGMLRGVVGDACAKR